MPKQKWNDDKIKLVLKQMPYIKDERSPEFIYHTIQMKRKRERKSRRLMPVLATVCTVMLLFIISQSFFDSNREDSFKGESKMADNSAEMKNKSYDTAETAESENYDMADEQEERRTTSLIPSAIYENEVGKQELLTYPIPDKNVQVIVPVSILVENPNQLSRFDLYVENVKKVIGVNKQLSSNFPISPELFAYDFRDDYIEVNVKQDFANFGSHSEDFFNTMVQQQLQTIGAKKMEFYTDGKLGAVLGNREETSIDYKPLENRAYFLLENDESDDQPLYVPWEKPYDSIENAFDAMEDNMETHGLVASIPDTIDIDKVSKDENKGELVVHLSNESKMEEDQKTLHAIESILLTAKDFKYSTVKFENTNVKEVGGFELTKELDVPVAANKVDIEQ